MKKSVVILAVLFITNYTFADDKPLTAEELARQALADKTAAKVKLQKLKVEVSKVVGNAVKERDITEKGLKEISEDLEKKWPVKRIRMIGTVRDINDKWFEREGRTAGLVTLAEGIFLCLPENNLTNAAENQKFYDLNRGQVIIVEGELKVNWQVSMRGIGFDIKGETSLKGIVLKDCKFIGFPPKKPKAKKNP